ncbi:hypothetical protein CTheo_4706 [Ceratobasidium theobromae]|uniref:Uncharacterized protein n=1 Tax=Ceratobasidium theobromae TaxID=1582974 RepID=A0A5N5QK45_9AGAM|nr:hypothetical protein CTheo_4706 [Ceratobasidium theobromae]
MSSHNDAPAAPALNDDYISMRARKIPVPLIEVVDYLPTSTIPEYCPIKQVYQPCQCFAEHWEILTVSECIPKYRWCSPELWIEERTALGNTKTFIKITPEYDGRLISKVVLSEEVAPPLEDKVHTIMKYRRPQFFDPSANTPLIRRYLHSQLMSALNNPANHFHLIDMAIGDTARAREAFNRNVLELFVVEGLLHPGAMSIREQVLNSRRQGQNLSLHNPSVPQ